MTYPTLTRLIESRDTPLKGNDVVDFIREHCKPWLAQGTKAYRGIRHPVGTRPIPQAFVRETRLDRNPKDSRDFSHVTMNQAIAQSGLIANRSNSMFVVGDPDQTMSYGDAHIVFPIGEFHYTWSPVMADAYTYMTGVLTDKFVHWAINAIVTGKADWIEDVLDTEHWEDMFDNIIDSDDSRSMAPTPEELKKIKHAIEASSMTHVHRAFRTAIVTTPGAVQDFAKYRGDDGSLRQALSTDHEVMIACKSAVYVTVGAYELLGFDP